MYLYGMSLIICSDCIGAGYRSESKIIVCPNCLAFSGTNCYVCYGQPKKFVRIQQKCLTCHGVGRVNPNQSILFSSV